MNFKLNQKVIIKTENEFYDYVDFLKKELGVKETSLTLNYGENEGFEIDENGVYIRFVYVKIEDVTDENICKVLDMLKCLKKFANVYIETCDMGVSDIFNA